MKIFIIGKSRSGKTTLATSVSLKLGIPMISAGEQVRSILPRGTSRQEMDNYTNTRLAADPDWTLDYVRERLPYGDMDVVIEGIRSPHVFQMLYEPGDIVFYLELEKEIEKSVIDHVGIGGIVRDMKLNAIPYYAYPAPVFELKDAIGWVLSLYNNAKHKEKTNMSDRKVLVSVDEYNSIETLENPNIVVIQYIEQGQYPLLSMKLGNFYLAEKVVYNGVEKYRMLSMEPFDRASDKDIMVTRSYASLSRFTEYPIMGWVEAKHFTSTVVCLFPVITHYAMPHSVNVFTGIAQRVSGAPVMAPPSNMTADAREKLYINMCSYVPEFRKLCRNSAIRNKTKIGVNIHYGNMTSVKLLKNRYVPEAVDEDAIELMVLSTHTPIKQHTTDQNIGINEDYLLLN